MKFKSHLFLLLLTLFALNTTGQSLQADSLLMLVNTTNKAEQKATYLNELGNLYRYSNLDSAYKYTSLAITISEQNKLHEQLTNGYTELGIIWYSKNRKDSSEYYLNKSYDIARKNKNYWGMLKSLNSTIIYKTKSKDFNRAFAAITEALGYVDEVNDLRLTAMLYNNIAIYNKANGNIDQALEYYHKALSVSEEQNNVKSIGLISSNMGLLYEQQDKTDLALKYLNKSLNIRLKQNNKLGESYVRTNLGLVHENLQEYEKALEQYRKSLTIKKEVGSSKGVAILYNNIGIIFKKQAVYDSAYFYCYKALDLRIKHNDKLGEARTRTTIGQVHFLSNDTGGAKKELEKALDLADNYRNFAVLQNICSSLYQVYAKQNDYKTANHYLLKNNAFKDSIFSIQKEKSIASIEARYSTLKKEKQNLQLAQENELKDARIKRQIIIGAGLIGMLILFSLLLFLVYLSRRRLTAKNKEIELQAKTLSETNTKLERLSNFKEAMTNMLVHDLKTPLNVIINIKTLKEMPSIDDLILQSGYNMQNLVTNILDVYKYQNSKLELHTNTILLSHTIAAAFEQVSFLITQKQLNICMHSEVDYQLNVDEELLKRVFINLLSNAIKFTPEKETISLSLQLETPEKLRISISNPGPGIPKEKQKLIFEYFKQAEVADHENIKSTGLGLTFCKLAIEAHNGEIGVISETQNGVEFWFTLPNVKQKLPLTTKLSSIYSPLNPC